MADSGAQQTSAAAALRHLARYRFLAQLFDAALRVPGTAWRVGIDPLIGLVPVLGDFAGALLASWGIWVAHRLGVPRRAKLRMAANVLIDALGGSVPLVGDLFDAGYKANLRNLAIIERHLRATGDGAR
ncbi:MAG: DUF4112 domain-containing protein [Steroidobacteraceae bacterium]